MAAALVKGSEKKFGASECSGNIGFLARQPLLPPTIQIVAPLQLNPRLPNRYIAERIFCRSNLFSLYKHAKVRWDQMKISECWASWILKRCFIDFYKISTEYNLLPVKDKMCNIWSSQSVSLSVLWFFAISGELLQGLTHRLFLLTVGLDSFNQKSLFP